MKLLNFYLLLFVMLIVQIPNFGGDADIDFIDKVEDQVFKFVIHHIHR